MPTGTGAEAFRMKPEWCVDESDYRGVPMHAYCVACGAEWRREALDPDANNLMLWAVRHNCYDEAPF